MSGCECKPNRAQPSKILWLSLLLASALAVAAPAALPQRNVGVIEGIVTRFGTTEGLSSVRITITRKDQQELASEPEAITDTTGRYIIRNAAPGEYTIRAALPGYIAPLKDGVPLEEGGAIKKITVDIEKPLTVNFSLAPGSVLAGRVFDPMGRPAESAIVEANLVSEAGSGVPSNRTIQADDRGQYRLWGLAPGRYRLSVDYRTNFAQVPLFVQDTWLKTYFPGTPDVSRAAFVEVGDGAVVEGLDFGFQVGQAFKISGRVIDPGRAARSGVPDFYLIPLTSERNKILEAPRMMANAQGQVPGRTEGAFEFRGIRAGRYLLYAEDWQVAPVERDNFVVSQVILDVASDITDVSLVMSGTSLVEGVVKTAADKPAANVRVALIPTSEDNLAHPMFYKEARTDSSGKFTIRGAMPGDYRMFAMDPADFKDPPLPASMYALPTFLEPYAAQGVAVRATSDGKLNVPLSTIRR
jgi:hypothetical protein